MSRIPCMVFMLCLCLFSRDAGSQIVLDRQVLSCFSLNMWDGEINYQGTAGEPLSNTISNENGFVTHGFHQPIANTGIQIAYTILKNDCDQMYEVNLTSVSGCGAQDTFEIYWNGQPSARLTKGLPATSQLFISSTGGCMYNLSFDFSQLEYTVRPCELIFYNYLSPNQDGNNDEWIVENIENTVFADNHVSIYNRWGVLVWEGNGYDNSNVIWNGKSSSGDILPDGTYYYKIEFNGVVKSGFIEVMR